MPALQHFFDAERQRRGWSVREAADRCRISVSKAYAIVNGDDNVELETFENIASAFDMTPADLAIAMGKGSPDHDPDEVEMLVVYRQVPAEQRPFIQRALRGLIEPAAPVPPTRPGRRRVTKPPDEFGRAKMDYELASHPRIPQWRREMPETESQRIARDLRPAFAL